MALTTISGTIQAQPLNDNFSYILDMTKVFVNVLSPPSPLVSAKGDGTLGDAIAIQAILNSYIGAIIIIPYTNSFYSIENTINVPSNTTLIINGTLKLANQANCVMFYLSNHTNIHIEGKGTLDGNKLNQTSPTGQGQIVEQGTIPGITAIACGGCVAGIWQSNNGITHSRISGLTFTSFNQWPMSLAGCTDVIVSDIKALDCFNAWGFTQSKDCHAINCFSQISGDMGFCFYGGCVNCSVENMEASYSVAGISIYSDQYSVGACHDIIIKNCFCHDNIGAGIYINTTVGDEHYNILIDGNKCNGNNTFGYTSSGDISYNSMVKHVIITNNESYNVLPPTAEGGTIAGIFVGGKCEDLIIKGNLILNAGIGKIGTGFGIYMTDLKINCLIDSNIINDNQATPTMQECIIIFGTDFDKKILVSNNILGNVRVGGMSAQLYTNSIGVVAKNNAGYNPVGLLSTQPAIPASDVVQVNTNRVPVQIFINGGTVTAIKLNGIATGLISGAFTLSPDETLTLTYSVAPTWTWFGL
jgi:hypothetical protein